MSAYVISFQKEDGTIINKTVNKKDLSEALKEINAYFLSLEKEEIYFRRVNQWKKK